MELAAVANVFIEVCNSALIGVSMAISLLAPSLYFFATTSGSSPVSFNGPTYDNLATLDSDEVDNHFRGSLFRLCPSLQEFGRSHVEWHPLNFYNLDASRYMVYIGSHGLLQLTLSENFWAELILFRILF